MRDRELSEAVLNGTVREKLGDRVRMTRTLIHRSATDAGGWTRNQLAMLGVEWPPTRGWLDGVDRRGLTLTAEQFSEFYRLGWKDNGLQLTLDELQSTPTFLEKL